MRDINSTDGEAESREAAAVRRVAPRWRPSETLTALQELVDLAATVPTILAHEAGLSTSELHALRHLSRSPMGPVELARALGVTSAASSGIVDRLETRGHVQRRPHAGDGRRTQVVMTESGSHEVITLLAPMFAALAELDAELDEAERAAVLRYLRGAGEAIRAATAGRAPRRP